jgi:hypothetical protein
MGKHQMIETILRKRPVQTRESLQARPLAEIELFYLAIVGRKN